MDQLNHNPCITCGACCAFFRASFYWGESDLAVANGVPSSMTVPISDFRLVMKGTRGSNPRCIALIGIIGEKVRCTIYDRRSTVCRDFIPSWQDGKPNERCDRARRHWGLSPLQPDVWHSPGDFPKAA